MLPWRCRPEAHETCRRISRSSHGAGHPVFAGARLRLLPWVDMVSGKRSRDKGNRLERLVVNTLRDAGQQASRVPLSGAAGGDFQDDIQWKLATQTLNLECKARAHGFGFLYDNLKPNVPLVIKADQQEPLFVCTLSQAIEMIGKTNISAQLNNLESPKALERSPYSHLTQVKPLAYSLQTSYEPRALALSSSQTSRGS